MAECPPGQLDRIVACLEAASAEIVPHLGLDRVDVVVAPTPARWLIPGWNLNAYAHGIARLTIGVDTTELETWTPSYAEQLRTTLAHELHHLRRFRGPGPHDTLGANLLAEGLAQCFQEQVGCPTPNYALAVRGMRLAVLAGLAREAWAETRYDHGRWFYGDRADPAWPWSGGYSLGYELVRRALVRRGTTASDDAALSAEGAWPTILPILEALELEQRDLQ
ncbi:hypothetical protein DK419_11865 [Methylobacterium terrae]|uniref:DUF2268 domain-containing protein n=2 Tax=Methylobacterium terrae TaxID=2202827 RepID=A0A2U8WXC4_9HYPH|nr:hypothetical protein DK419_11865 [Methylobacterium terrae]